MNRPKNEPQNTQSQDAPAQNASARAGEEPTPPPRSLEVQATSSEAAPAPGAARRRALAVSAPAQVAGVIATDEACARLRPDLKAYQDEQLGWRRRHSIRRHFKQCAACREEMAAMREFSAKWRDADAGVLDPGLRARILAAVPDTPPALSSVARPRPARRNLALAGAGAAAIVGAALLYPVWKQNAPTAHEDGAKTTAFAPPVAATSGAAVTTTAHADAPGVMRTDAPTMSRRVVASTMASHSYSASSLPPAKSAYQVADARPLAANAASETHSDMTASAGKSLADSDMSDQRQAAGGQKASALPSRESAPAAGVPAPPTAPAPEAGAVGSAMQAATPATPQTPRKRAVAAMSAARPADKRKAAKYTADKSEPQTAKAAIRDAAPATLLAIQAARVDTAAANIERDVRALGGTVEESATKTDADGAKSATLRLQVPAAGLDAFLTRAAQSGTVLSRSVPRDAVAPVPSPAGAASLSKADAPARAAGRRQAGYAAVTILLQGR